MWFKNIQVFRFTEPFELSEEQLVEKLAAFTFQPCARQEHSSYGWVSPMGRHGESLTHTVQGCVMICARQEQKLLPSTLIKELVEDAANEIYLTEGRTVGRRERQDLKDQMIQSLLPTALVKSRLQYAYIDRLNGWLLIDTSSAAHAEALMTALRKAIGTLPLEPIQTSLSPGSLMTQWVLGESHLPQDFSLGGDCELRDQQNEGGAIVFKNLDLACEHLLGHIKDGMQIHKLALEWADGIRAFVDTQLVIRRLKFEDKLLEEAADAEDAQAQFDQEFAVMTLQLSHFLRALFQAFGGIESDQAQVVIEVAKPKQMLPKENNPKQQHTAKRVKPDPITC